MPATLLPQRSSLVAETVAVLERGLREARWRGQLPGQHTLCAELMISRTTLRAALRELARRGHIQLAQGCATAIRRRGAAASAGSRISRVVLLLPEPLWRLRPTVGRWTGELRALLHHSGLELIQVEDRRYYAAKPEPRLARLRDAHPGSAWVLFAATLAMQRWFAASGLPAIVAASYFPGIALPSVEYDHAAIAQHAAARLAALGHRRTAILLQHTGTAADDATRDAFAAARPAGAPPPVLLEHDGSPGRIEARLRTFVALRERPTAIFISKSHAVPAAFTILPRLGLTIPRDVSIICREDDSFLDYLVPAVTRYASDPSAIARRLALSLSRLAAGHALANSHVRLMPRLIAGASIAIPARG